MLVEDGASRPGSGRMTGGEVGEAKDGVEEGAEGEGVGKRRPMPGPCVGAEEGDEEPPERTGPRTSLSRHWMPLILAALG